MRTRRTSPSSEEEEERAGGDDDEDDGDDDGNAAPTTTPSGAPARACTAARAARMPSTSDAWVVTQPRTRGVGGNEAMGHRSPSNGSIKRAEHYAPPIQHIHIPACPGVRTHAADRRPYKRKPTHATDACGAGVAHLQLGKGSLLGLGGERWVAVQVHQCERHHRRQQVRTCTADSNSVACHRAGAASPLGVQQHVVVELAQLREDGDGIRAGHVAQQAANVVEQLVVAVRVRSQPQRLRVAIQGLGELLLRRAHHAQVLVRLQACTAAGARAVRCCSRARGVAVEVAGVNTAADDDDAGVGSGST